MINGLRSALSVLVDFRDLFSSAQGDPSPSNISKFREALAAVCVAGLWSTPQKGGESSPPKRSALLSAGANDSKSSARREKLFGELFDDRTLKNRVQVDGYAGTCRARVFEAYDESTQVCVPLCPSCYSF